jgi:hypothetical protein
MKSHIVPFRAETPVRCARRLYPSAYELRVRPTRYEIIDFWSTHFTCSDANKGSMASSSR